MKKRYIFLLVPVISALASCKWLDKETPKSFSETFSAGVFNEANAIVASKTGGYILAGYAIEKDDPNDKNMPSAIYLVKVGEDGHSVWEKQFNFSNFDEATDIAATNDGNYIVTGQTMNGNGDLDMILIKINEKGDTLWTKVFGSEDASADIGNAILQGPDNGYMVAGATGSFDLTNSEDPEMLCVVKTDPKGTPEWNKIYTNSGRVEARDIKATNGGYIIAGTTNNATSQKEEPLLIKITAQGDTIWSKTFGSNANDNGISVVPATDGYLIAGTTRDSTGNQDILVIKTDTAGNTLWRKTYGDKEPDDFADIKPIKGGYVLAGSSYNSTHAGNGFLLIKLDEKGNAAWTQTYPAEKNETAHSVTVAPDGGFVLAGVKDGDSRSYMYLVKVDANGKLQTNKP